MISNIQVNEDGSFTVNDPRLAHMTQVRIISTKGDQVVQHTLTGNKAPTIANDMRVKHVVEGPHRRQELAVKVLKKAMNFA